MSHALKVTKYQLHDSSRAVLTYYLIMASLLVFLALVRWFAPAPGPINMSGLEMSTAVFLFVAGLNCFKPSFKCMSAFGVSRRRFFGQNVLALLALAGLATVVDTLFAAIYRMFLNYKSLQEILYPSSNAFSGIIWLFFVHTAAVMLGWFITLLYYRSGKQLKLLISLSPVFLSIGLGFANTFTHGKVSSAIRAFFLSFWGAKTMNPHIAVMSLSLSIVLLGTLIFLMIRRAPVKN